MASSSSCSSDEDKAKSSQTLIKRVLEENADYARARDLVDKLIDRRHYSTLVRYQDKRAKILAKELPNPTPREDLAVLLEWKAIIAAHLNQDPDVAYQYANDAVAFHKRGTLVNVEQIVPIIAKGLYRQGPAYLSKAIATYRIGYFHPDTSQEWKDAHHAIVEQWISESIASREEVNKEEASQAVEKVERKNQRERERIAKQEQVAKEADKRRQKKEVDVKSSDKGEDAKVKEGSQGLKKDKDIFGKRFENCYTFTHVDGNLDCCERVEMLGLGKEVGSSLVKPSGNQLLLFEKLRQLCGTHRSLLTIFHVARDDIAHVEGPYLLTERVSTIEEYFKRKLTTLRSTMDTPLTIEIWWKDIEEEFQCIFRDVIQGLLHLYLNCGRGCGHIAFNTFLTDNGEGRILPSMDDIKKESYSSKDVEDEARELISLMKNVIIFPFVDDLKKTKDAKLGVNLPSELIHFFSFTCNYKPEVPPSFWLDHPYFWSVPNHINFAYKLNRISKRDDWKKPSFIENLNTASDDSYEDWWKRLTGSYLEVWKKGEKGEKGKDKEDEEEEFTTQAEGEKGEKGKDKEDEKEEFMTQTRPGYYKVKPYKEPYDLIRFVGAVYTHVNDQEYRRRQGRDPFADTDIEADLDKFFPDYYTVMFETVCRCVASRSIDVESLMEISSFPFGSNVFWRTSRMQQYIVGLSGVDGVKRGTSILI